MADITFGQRVSNILAAASDFVFGGKITMTKVTGGNTARLTIRERVSNTTESALYNVDIASQTADNYVLRFASSSSQINATSSVTVNIAGGSRITCQNTNAFTNSGYSISIGSGSAPVASAALELTSTSKGFLPPRMTAVQAEAISSPAEGLMVYSTTGTGATITTKGWWGYDGAAWKKLDN